MPDNGISFKATTEGLVIILNERDDFDSLCKKIEKKLVSAGSFFKGAELAVKYRGRNLGRKEEKRLIELIGSNSGARITDFVKDNENTAAKKSTTMKRPQIKKHMYFQGIMEGETRFCRGTVRSGQLLEFAGNVVVLGDVNPGAEIKAAGNVVVMGYLRGVVHAGCDGNRRAVVAAYNLQPTQLRIADLITRPPDETAAKEYPVPEIAFVKDGMVYIDKCCHK